MISRFFVSFVLAFLVGCVSSSEDAEVAAKVGKYLAATGVVPADTREADRTHAGRIVYVGPGMNGSPHFTYYEVTIPDDVRKLKRAAEEALAQVPEVRKITLHFREKQVLRQATDGSVSRGMENEIVTIVVKREQ